MSLRLAAFYFLLALALTACGKKADLESPEPSPFPRAYPKGIQ